MKKILINATNLHSGGGVQVASSFIYELSLLISGSEELQFKVLISTEVEQSLPSNIRTDKFDSFEVVNTLGFKKPPAKLFDLSEGCDLSFTIFGPQYYTLRAKYSLVGFAQPWIIYPKNPLYKNMNLIKALCTKVKFFIQKKAFKKSNYLVVEHDEVRSRLVEQGRHRDEIFVVPNAVSAPFLDPSIRQALKPIKINENFIFGYVGRAYEHKNLKVLKQVDALLKLNYGLEIAFVFTLSSREMESLGFDSLPNFYTHGVISNLQCPDFYSQIDAFIFPSLLECFSAAPLEAMISSKPIFASDYSFIKNIYGQSVYYFNPLEAESIAEVIASNIFDGSEVERRVSEGLKFSQKASTAKQRTQSYYKLINKIIQN